MNKQTTIDENILQKIRVYAEIEGKTQVDFTNELLNKALDEYLIKRSGGAIFTMRNPQTFPVVNDDAKRFIIDIGVVATNAQRHNIHTPLMAIASFLDKRLFLDSDTQRKTYEQNKILDNI